MHDQATGLKIGSKLALLLCAFTTLSAATIGLVAYTQLNSRLSERSLESMTTDALQASHVFEAQIQTLREDTLAIVGSTSLRGIVRCHENGGIDPIDGSTETIWRQRLEAELMHIQHIKSQYLQLRLIGIEDEGKEIVRIDGTAKGPKRIAHENLQSKGHRPYVAEAMKINASEVYLSEISLNQENNQIQDPHTPVIRTATPVLRSDNTVFGCVVINLDLRSTFARLRSTVGQNRSLKITNDHGDFLEHPDPARPFAHELGMPFRLKDESVALADKIDAAESSYSSILPNAAGESEVIAAIKTTLTPSQLDRRYTFIVSAPYRVVAAAHIASRNQSILLGVALILIALLFAALISFNLSKPIRQMTAAVMAFRTDRQIDKLPVTARDEIGVLARAMQEMFETIQSHAFALEMEISERTRAEALLAAGAKELAASNASLEQFAYAASHDLRAPLRAVDNLAQWIEEDTGDNLPDESRENLRRLRSRVTRMDGMVESLLQFSRAGRTPGEIHVASTEKAIADICDLLEIPEDFEVAIAASLPTFSAYWTPLKQVFLNLISNAAKHHDRTQGRIDISASDAGDFYRFSVSDDGPGIPDKFRDRVFGIFQTLKPRDEVEGSGMGLALVKRLVEWAGGMIWIEGNKHALDTRGVSFLFTWPKNPPKETNR